MDYNERYYQRTKIPPREYSTFWVDVTQMLNVGGVLEPSDKYPVGYTWQPGTPVELDILGSNPRFDEDATSPIGILLRRVVMGERGCTFAIVTQGVIFASKLDERLTEEQYKRLKDRIRFDGLWKFKEEDLEACFSLGYWINSYPWLNYKPWKNNSIDQESCFSLGYWVNANGWINSKAYLNNIIK